MKKLIYLTLLTPFFAVNTTTIQPTLSFGGKDNVKTYSAKAVGNLNGLKYDYYQINNYIYNYNINDNIPTDIFFTITQIKFTLPSIENISIDIQLLSKTEPWKYNNSLIYRQKPYTSHYADFLTTQDYTKQMYFINNLNLGEWNNADLWDSINRVFDYNELAYLVYGEYGTSFLAIDTTKIFNTLNGAYGVSLNINKIDDLPSEAPNTDLNFPISINANNTEYKEFYYTRIQIGTCEKQSPNTQNVNGYYTRNTYNFILSEITTDMELLPPSTTPTTTDVVDIPQLMFTILTLPFAFISQAFNLTLFPGTPYAINISNLIVCLIAVFLLIFVLNIIKKVLK